MNWTHSVSLKKAMLLREKKVKRKRKNSFWRLSGEGKKKQEKKIKILKDIYTNIDVWIYIK